ncbi:DUF443 family protein [Virgibacillus sp. FSP13]
MRCMVYGVFKNLRYRILIIDERQYIIDMGRSFWKFLFPFVFWMFPNPVYRVDDPNIVEKLKSPEVNQTETGRFSGLGAGIGIFITTLLKPVADYFALPDNPLINAVILSVLVIFVIVMVASINNKFKKRLQNAVNLEELSTDKLWIRPRSVKHFVQGVFTYLFILVLTLVFFYLSIVESDVITLIFTVGVLLFYVFTNVLWVTVGTTTVKFKGGKKIAE